MKHGLPFLLLSCLVSAGLAQTPPLPGRIEIVPIGEDEAAEALAHLLPDQPAVPLPSPVKDLRHAITMVGDTLGFVPRKRVGECNGWVFFPRFDRAEDDRSFNSGFAVQLGQQALRKWDTKAQDLARWTFEPPVPDLSNPAPAVGHGTAVLVGGTAGGTGSGAGPRSFAGWNTYGYAPQNTASGTRGVQFNVSTLGFSNISLSFDHRSSRTGSRWARLDYSTDGKQFVPLWTNNGALSPPDSYQHFLVSLRGVPGVNNNPDFAFRVVSIFSPESFQENSSAAWSPPDSAYMRASAEASYPPNPATGKGRYALDGTWRFDNVAVTGVELTEWAKRIILLERILLVACFLAAALMAAFTGRIVRSTFVLSALLVLCFVAFNHAVPAWRYLVNKDAAALADSAPLATTFLFLALAGLSATAFAAAASLVRWMVRRFAPQRSRPSTES